MKKVFSTKLFIIVLFLTLACFGEAVFAGSEKHKSEEKTGDHMAEVFAYKDKNKDGVIAKEEWPYGEDYFNKIDKNGDGKLSLEEFKAKEKSEDMDWKKEGKTILFKDKDNNGLITLEEWKGSSEEFQSFDADQNGSLSKEESAVALELGKDFHHGCISKYFDKKLCGMDMDKDGSLSKAEWKCSQKEFTKLDKDQNALISNDELKGCCRSFKDFQSFHKMECHKDENKGSCSKKFDLKEKFAAKDANKDGKISSEEWAGCPNAFKTMDKDGDGNISLEEFEAKFQLKEKDLKSLKGCPKAAGEKKKKEPEQE